MEQLPKKTKKVERLNEMPEEWRILRAEILKKFGERKTEGLDIGRVKDFMKECGLPVIDLVMIENEDIPQLSQILKKKYPDSDANFSEEVLGRYFSEMELCFIRRKRNNEKDNGAIRTESTLIHELIHGASKYASLYIKSDEGYTNARIGFFVDNTHLTRKEENKTDQKENKKAPWGEFLEEGFASMIEGEYTQRYMPEKTREELDKNFIKLGFSPKNTHDTVRINFHAGIGYGYSVSEKFLFLDPTQEDGLSWSVASIAATGLEMLCEKEPKLRQVLIEARNDISKLREIPRLINAIQPGLYMKIQKCDYDAKDFARVQNIIKEAIKNSA